MKNKQRLLQSIQCYYGSLESQECKENDENLYEFLLMILREYETMKRRIAKVLNDTYGGF